MVNIPQQDLDTNSSWEWVEPRCEYFGSCGGCQLQHLAYPSQLKWKRNLLVEVLAGLVPTEKIAGVVPSPLQWHYRRRIQVHATPRGEPGFYGAGSSQVVPIAACAIADARLNEALPEVQANFAERMAGRGRPSRLGCELTLLPDGSVSLQDLGEDRYFLQNNPGANQRLLEDLKTFLAGLEVRRVLELFAGSGNLALSLCGPPMEWTAVESDPAATQVGQIESKGRALPIKWKAEKVHRFLRGVAAGAFDLVILDPPRGGAGRILPALIHLAAPQIIYLSCSPTALAEDLKGLLREGYEIQWVKPYDFFPQTTHVECLVHLRQRGGKAR